MALAILASAYKGKTHEHKLELLGRVPENPALYKEHVIIAPLAADLLFPKIDKTSLLSAIVTGLTYFNTPADPHHAGAIYAFNLILLYL